MKAPWVEPVFDKLMEQKWSKMLVLSFLLHLAVFFTILFVPDSMPARRIKGTVYEVNLVEMPAGRKTKAKESTRSGATRKQTRTRKAVPAKRITTPKKKQKPVVMAKRVVKRKTRKIKKTKTSPSRLIDKALLKIKKKVRADAKDPVKQALSRLEKRVKSSPGDASTRGDAVNGISIRFYQMEVEDRIKSNWSYPVDLAGPKNKKDLEAIVVVKVQNNGAILKIWFKKRSSNTIFNQSVLKAVERSDPLPPFPEGYRKTYDQIEINFNLKDLEGL